MTSYKKTASRSSARNEPSPPEINMLVALFKQGRYAEIEAPAREMTSRFPLHGFGWKAMGTVLLQQGRTAEALAPLQKAAELSPGDAQLHNNLGNALAKLDRLSEAEASYRQVLKLNPGFAEAHHNLGNTLQKLGRLSEAEATYRKALELKPDFASAHNNLGNTLLKLDRLPEAEASYRRALELKPDYAEAHSNLGDALNGLDRLSEAEASYRRALELKPDYAEVHYSFGNTLKEQGRFSEAESSYRRALELNPSFVEAYQNLGNTLSYLGKLNEAIASYQRSLELKPNDAGVLYNLHALLLNPMDMEPSIQCMKDAVALQPDDKNYRFFLGLILEYAGDYEAAATHLDLASTGDGLVRARLDAWGYIKSSCAKFPHIFGSSIQTFRFAIEKAINKGMILEFGVRHGTSIRQIASLVTQELHGFDSFEGLPEAWHHEPRGSYSTKGAIPSVPENVTLHKGWFEDTLPIFLEKFSGPVRCMNIDCDIYSSTKTILECLAERITSGAVIIFDEYIGNERWREDEFKAFQEAAVKHGWDYEYLGFSFYTKQVVIRII